NPLNSSNFAGTGFDTLYVADDRTTVNGGGIQRWVYDGANWNLTATLATAGGGARGLTGSIAGSTVALYATTAETTQNTLITFTDALTAAGGAFSAATVLATAPTNTVFRGVDFTPVPEPGGLLLCSLAACAGISRLARGRIRPQFTAASSDSLAV